ncbi:hypothetical protein JTE90_021301 [Oedothorax gibbosus]|uniref:Uncharacterized protein n=1 Tax=Oedothorax gibbosus TaxID=931172 RepID=A0AAV6VN31_9ARAC|nr:hypothetical protein JTE90_021301 [Oedothorax gibbosus]
MVIESSERGSCPPQSPQMLDESLWAIIGRGPISEATGLVRMGLVWSHQMCFLFLEWWIWSSGFVKKEPGGCGIVEVEVLIRFSLEGGRGVSEYLVFTSVQWATVREMNRVDIAANYQFFSSCRSEWMGKEREEKGHTGIPEKPLLGVFLQVKKEGFLVLAMSS